MDGIVILGGGAGTRMFSTLGHGCKILAPIHGRPWIETAIGLLGAAIPGLKIIVNVNDEHVPLFSGAGVEGGFDFFPETERRGVGYPLAEAVARFGIDGRIALLLGDIIFDSAFPAFLQRQFGRLAQMAPDHWLTVTRPQRGGNRDYDVIDFAVTPPRVVLAATLPDAEGLAQVGGCLILPNEMVRQERAALCEGNLGFTAVHNFLFGRGYVGQAVDFDGLFEDFGTEARYRDLVIHADRL